MLTRQYSKTSHVLLSLHVFLWIGESDNKERERSFYLLRPVRLVVSSLQSLQLYRKYETFVSVRLCMCLVSVYIKWAGLIDDM